MLINYVYLLNKNKDIRYKRTDTFYTEKIENSGVFEAFEEASGTSFMTKIIIMILEIYNLLL